MQNRKPQSLDNYCNGRNLQKGHIFNYFLFGVSAQRTFSSAQFGQYGRPNINYLKQFFLNRL